METNVIANMFLWIKETRMAQADNGTFFMGAVIFR